MLFKTSATTCRLTPRCCAESAGFRITGSHNVAKNRSKYLQGLAARLVAIGPDAPPHRPWWAVRGHLDELKLVQLLGCEVSHERTLPVAAPGG